MKKDIRIGITLGDPIGIGPEITLKAISEKNFQAQFAIYGSKTSYDKARKVCGLNPELESFHTFEKPVAAVRGAVTDVLNKKLDFIVTAPLNKEKCRDEDAEFTGHTEFLAKISSVKKATMLFVTKDFKVALVTMHIPLNKVSTLLTEDLLSTTIEQTHYGLKKLWKIENPKIAMCGLNPHAGENGLFGDEEMKIIFPVVKKFKSRGIDIVGPFGADTILSSARRHSYDAVISNYHDQLLPAVKLSGEAVNLTLGLPFIRTSVDHGVGYDIYGKNIANPSSMIAAISLGIELINIEKLK